jgi:hypothetical protein
MDITAPTNFYVSAFTPIEAEVEQVIAISGTKLDLVTEISLPLPNGETIELEAQEQTTDYLVVKLPPEATRFMMLHLVLMDEEGSWLPVGPFVVRPERDRQMEEMAGIMNDVLKRDGKFTLRGTEISQLRGILNGLGYDIELDTTDN